ncbi:MAG: NAD regulator [Pseudomonadota bacterium]
MPVTQREISPPSAPPRREAAPVEIGLNAAIVAVHQDEPVLLTVRGEPDAINAVDGLPFGPFNPLEHRTLDIGLRSWVHDQTGLQLGYVEQLYTFGDRGRHAQAEDTRPHTMSIGYLALTQANDIENAASGHWRSWYQFFPWEDWRKGRPDILEAVIEPALRRWADQKPFNQNPYRLMDRAQRNRLCFGFDGGTWDEEKVLDRYELLYEAGLILEAQRDRPERVTAKSDLLKRTGLAMRYDHRRILATAIGRVRAKIKYRPVIFEMMPTEFTLFELQKTVEAILGPHLHKQNFRRLVESAGLVEPTGEMKTRTGGRPAKLFRFRRDVVLERPAPGVRVKAVGTRG